MSKTQIILAAVLVLSIVAFLLPWVTANVLVDGEHRWATNHGYDYIFPGAEYAGPAAILCVIGFALSAYSFKARNKIRKLNVIAGILILVGVLAAFAYTAGAAMAGIGGTGSYAVHVEGRYGMGLEILFGFLMIIFGARARPPLTHSSEDPYTKSLGVIDG